MQLKINYKFLIILMFFTDTLLANQSTNLVSNKIHPAILSLSTQELAKSLSNPLAPLIFMPIVTQRFQWHHATSAQNASGISVSLRPTVPIFINDKLLTINHAVIPYFHIPSGALYPDNGAVYPDFESTTTNQPGYSNIIGPMQFMSIFTPNKAHGFNIGIGPYLNIPIGKILGMNQNIGLGMAGILKYDKNAWVLSAIVQNAWSITQNGNASRFSQFMFTPSISYNFPSGWSLLSVPYITADFDAPRNNWFVPIGGGIGKIVHFDKIPVQFIVHAYDDIIRTRNDPAWTARFSMIFVFSE